MGTREEEASFRPIGFLLGVLALWLAGVASADVPLPRHPEARARFSPEQGCVEPTQVMRRRHMDFLLHQRDETMHRGIRTKRHSLKECVDCHAAQDKQGNFIPVNEKDQFCESCHEYAAVHIDCFECHATVPEEKP
ncbi:MAG: Hdr-like menaquinol oxidoreductase cytochrome c subunit [Gammaproteobacteria bacterium]|nr:MAG: Hdr-like menaquinol oxidoreductase cytochrome c subunit [Gammaproteobacteria bacterium]